MKEEHTPGPWKATAHGAIEHESGFIGEAYDFDPGLDGTGGDKLPHANARLMAAAPELLELLKTCLRWMEHLHYLYDGEFSERVEPADDVAKEARELIQKIEKKERKVLEVKEKFPYL